MTTPLVAAVTDYEESVESPLAAKYSRSVARTALHGALAAERARYAALVAAARAVVTVWDADGQSIGLGRRGRPPRRPRPTGGHR